MSDAEKGPTRPRVLLLQVRDEPRAEEQERLCFLEAGGLWPEQLTCHNLVAEIKRLKAELENQQS